MNTSPAIFSRRDFLNRAARGAISLSFVAGLAGADNVPPVRKVHVIFKTHLDIGYTDLAANVLEKYFNDFIPAAVRLAKETREAQPQQRFKWTTGAWLIHTYLQRADAEQRKAMEEAILAGDICWHALPFTTHSEALHASVFEAGMQLSKALDERYQRTTISAKMTDVPGHTRGIVPLLQRAGVRLLHIGVNGASMPPDVPPVFVWQAPDGSRIIVMCQAEYGGITRISGTDEALAIIFTGDNHGPQTAAQVAEAYDNLQEQFPGAEVVASDLDEVARVVSGVEGQLPAITSEIGDSWIHGIGSDPWKIARMRELSRLREHWLRADRLTAGSTTDLAFAVPLAMIGEHTWGLDIKSYLKAWDIYTPEALQAARSTEPFQRVEASWQEKRDYLKQAVDALSPALREEAGTALGALSPDPPDLAAFEAMAEPGGTVTTASLAFALDPATGAVGRLQNRKTGRSWVSPARPFALFAYQTFSQAEYDRFLDQYLTVRHQWALEDFGKVGIDAFAPLSRTCPTRLKAAWRREEEDATVILAELEVLDETGACPPGCPRRLTTEYRLSKTSPKMEITLQWFEKPANRLPEAMWFSFVPGTQPDGVWAMDKMGQDVDPCDVVKNGGRKLHGIESSIRYLEAENVLSIASLDAPLVAPGERSLLNFDNALPKPEEGMHFCLCNNVWGTNFVMWFDEDMRFRFTVKCG